MAASTELATLPLDQLAGLASSLAPAESLPKALRGKVADVLLTVLAGRELGIEPATALRTIHIIEGKPVLSAHLMMGVVMGRNVAVRFECIEESDSSVTYETLRKGYDRPQRCTWTIVDAKRAALDKKDNWRMYPRAMLHSRAIADLARRVYPDVLAGCYTEDEADSFRAPTGGEPLPRRAAPASDHADAIDAEVVEGGDSEIEKLIATATTFDELKTLAPKVNGLRKGTPERVAAQAAYNARKVELQATPSDVPHAATQESAA